MCLTVVQGELTAGWPGAQRLRDRERDRQSETEREWVLTVKLPQAYQWAFNRPLLTTKPVCVSAGKGRGDSNERPVSCIGDHSNAQTFTSPAPHLETTASQTRHLTRCHLTCWHATKLWRSQGNNGHVYTAAEYRCHWMLNAVVSYRNGKNILN